MFYSYVLFTLKSKGLVISWSWHNVPAHFYMGSSASKKTNELNMIDSICTSNKLLIDLFLQLFINCLWTFYTLFITPRKRSELGVLVSKGLVISCSWHNVPAQFYTKLRLKDSLNL